VGGRGRPRATSQCRSGQPSTAASTALSVADELVGGEMELTDDDILQYLDVRVG
jgi:hypothetical protein